MLSRAVPLDERAFGELINEGVCESGYTEALARVALHWDREGGCSVSLILRPYAGAAPERLERGVELMTVAGRRGPAHGQDWRLKASDYVSGVLAHLDTEAMDGAPGPERLFLTPEGYVSETTVANVFIVKGKRLLTPMPGSGILVGVTRSAVLETAPLLGLEPVETLLTRHDLYTADECFLTSASCEALPVVRVDGRTIGSGRPGPLTRQLLRHEATSRISDP
ncbi:MAG: Branched-chain-amino-acid aminotransferase [Candidatus Omnitrophica bacterium]|nr:Branched-chain-amino-acid aminotransferase [Candidatus Omnitrophota bacterium]